MKSPAYIKGRPNSRTSRSSLMTGAFEQIDEARARDVGCDGVLAKPFEPHMAIALVRQLLAGERPGLAPAADGASAPAPAGVPLATRSTPRPPRRRWTITSTSSTKRCRMRRRQRRAHAAIRPAVDRCRRGRGAGRLRRRPGAARPARGVSGRDRRRGVAPSPPSDMATSSRRCSRRNSARRADAVPFTLANVARPARPDVTPPSPPAPGHHRRAHRRDRAPRLRPPRRSRRQGNDRQPGLAVAERLVREEIDRLKTQA